MSAYSDWRAGALTDEEYDFYSKWEARKERYWDERAAEKEYYTDDDIDYFEEDDEE